MKAGALGVYMAPTNQKDSIMIDTNKKAALIVGGNLTKTTKMPCASYSLPAAECKQGSKLRKLAGSVCSDCYACKGNYKRYEKSISKAQYRRLGSITHPYLPLAMQKLIGGAPLFRWHDSGDLQSMDHLEQIIKVAKLTPETQHWLPTKESALIKKLSPDQIPNNLIIRLSATMIDGKAPIYDQTSTVVTDPALATCRSFENNGACGDCRKCWDRTVKNIA